MLNTENGEGIDFDNDKPKGKGGNWKKGMNPDALPSALREVFFTLNESYEMEDLQAVGEKLAEFGLIEEQQAVFRCFASDERTKISAFMKSEDYTKIVNQEKVDYLNGEELEQFLNTFSN